MRDMEEFKRIGSGICGEVYRMVHRPSGMAIGAKVFLITIILTKNIYKNNLIYFVLLFRK